MVLFLCLNVRICALLSTLFVLDEIWFLAFFPTSWCVCHLCVMGLVSW